MSATGAEPREIAERLFLTYGTVRNYLTSAVAKLGARNRVDAIRIATRVRLAVTRTLPPARTCRRAAVPPPVSRPRAVPGSPTRIRRPAPPDAP
ncbi:response regulator transcription factor [Actinomadura rupiterrae]|uniref:response regulator transcription factor n=1 Tax=Actinomadura rupiterrae TaxID=559627 RepID=UPI0035572242